MAFVNPYVNGSDIMLFREVVSGGTTTLKPLAYCTSHSMSVSAESQSVSNKDCGKFGASIAGTITWEITSSSLYAVADYDEVMAVMLSREPIRVYMGMKEELNSEDGLVRAGGSDSSLTEWTPEFSAGMYSGVATITSLSLNADNGSVASYDATFTGSGPLVRVSAKV